MDAALTYGAAKSGAEMVTALARLAAEAKKSKNPSLQDLMAKLRGEALHIVSEFNKSMLALPIELKSHGIDPKESVRQADEKIRWWHLGQRLAFRRFKRNIVKAASDIQELYSDIEAAFLCAQDRESVAAGVKSAYEIRDLINKTLSDDSSIGEITALLQKTLNDAKAILEAS